MNMDQPGNVRRLGQDMDGVSHPAEHTHDSSTSGCDDCRRPSQNAYEAAGGKVKQEKMSLGPVRNSWRSPTTPKAT
jgi:hypothetical protein